MVLRGGVVRFLLDSDAGEGAHAVFAVAVLQGVGFVEEERCCGIEGPVCVVGGVVCCLGGEGGVVVGLVEVAFFEVGGLLGCVEVDVFALGGAVLAAEG